MPALYGTNGPDTLLGGSGADTIDGGSSLPGGAAADTGADSLNGNGGNDFIYGRGGNDTVIGGAGFDNVDGGDGTDSLVDAADGFGFLGGAGDDTIAATLDGVFLGTPAAFGAEGNDSIVLSGDGFGGISGAFVYGEGGNDTIAAGGSAPGHDVYGGTGNDSLSGGTGTDTLRGDAGDDTADGGQGADVVLGGGGRDRLAGGDDADVVADQDAFGDAENPLTPVGPIPPGDTLTGGNGNDSLYSLGLGDRLDGGADVDLAVMDLGNAPSALVFAAPAAGVTATLVGGGSVVDAEIYNVSGTGFGDSVAGGAGNDTIQGQGANDTLAGGAGSDVLLGGEGNDSLSDTAEGGDWYGGDGDDSIAATLGGAFLATPNVLGGEGNDSIVLSGDGFGGISGAFVYGEGGNDTIAAGGTAPGHDVYGGTGNDSLSGGTGTDTLRGETGDDTIVAGGGDLVSGGNGNDQVVVGPTGTNTLDGGADTDTLAFNLLGEMTITGTAADFTYAGPGGLSGTALNFEFIRDIGGNLVAIQDILDGDGTVPVCFAAGTLILTTRGEVPVEALQAGDQVATLGLGGAPVARVLWIGRRRILLAGHKEAASLAPVRIAAGALGAATPHRDLLVSPDHCLFLDGVLVPARVLVNGTTIAVERAMAEVSYFHVELDRHDILLAEGAGAESWLDTGNREWFANAKAPLLHIAAPLEAMRDPGRACAAVIQGGPQLAALRALIAWRSIASEPDTWREAG